MGDLTVRVLPVEPRDCLLLRFPDDSWAVIDSGGDRSAAEQAVAIVQNAEPGGKPVRFILATHDHTDHIGGVPWLLSLCPKPIGAFYHSAVERKVDDGTPRGTLDYLSEARNLRTRGRIGEVRALQARDVIEVRLDPPESVLRIPVLNPDQAQVDQGPVSGGTAVNNVSVVLQIDFHGVRLMLAGDMEDVGWKNVVSDPEFRPPNVLKVPHHGSINGRPPKSFFDQVELGGWALLSTPTGDGAFPDLQTLQAFWEASWRTRCTSILRFRMGWLAHQELAR